MDNNNSRHMMARLIMAGFDPETVIKAFKKNDWRILKHTGLYSIQLLPPESPPNLLVGQEFR